MGVDTVAPGDFTWSDLAGRPATAVGHIAGPGNVKRSGGGGDTTDLPCSGVHLTSSCALLSDAFEIEGARFKRRLCILALSQAECRTAHGPALWATGGLRGLGILTRPATEAEQAVGAGGQGEPA